MLAASLLFFVRLGTTPPPAVPHREGFGPWRLGMTREEVAAVAEYEPYTPVASTGGLETRNGLFAGQKATVSFIFGEKGLRLIQIWAYEGQSVDEAVSAFFRVYQHLESTCGELETELGLPEHASASQFHDAVEKALSEVPPRRPAKLQLAPLEKSPGAAVFATFMTQPQVRNVYVFLYYRAP
ncbi:MAG TPA: hypothetical protein VEG84_01370 [Thermoanaerobaculia bacterium]|nr:hypothetical protein [Thermoanaerobaculia bacterium]